jgi:polysaccharide biosynthesis/export protein
MKKTLAIFICIFLLTATVSAQHPEYKLQPTDVLHITVHDQPDLTTTTRITADGNITFPLIGTVSALGLTVQQLETTLKDLLEKDYLVTAQVIVFINEYHQRQVSVIGEVNAPGKYDLPGEKGITLLEAIALAGGFTKDADINKTQVMRVKDGITETIVIRVSDITNKGIRDQDIPIEPEDVIFVPESFF